MPSRALLVLTTFTLGACPSDEAPKPSATTAAAAAEKPETKPEVADPTADAGGDADAGTPEAPAGDKFGLTAKERKDLETASARVRTHLGAARDKVKEGDWKTAIAEYSDAANLDDDNPHILGELGWAFFMAENNEKAEHFLRLALRYSRDDEGRAKFLYQLGRVEEARGEFAKAKVHYDHSLAIKEDPETREHDEAVAGRAAEECKGDGCDDEHEFADLDAACAYMVARVHEQQGHAPGSEGAAFTCDTNTATKVAITGGEATEAALLVVKGESAGTEEEETDLLVHTPRGWHWIGTVLDLENPHHGAIERSGSVKGLVARELLPDSPGDEIMLHVELIESDADLDDNMVYHDEHEAFIVCSFAKGEHGCHEIPTRMSWVAEPIDPALPMAHDAAGHSFDAKAEFDGKGNVTVTGEGAVPEEEVGTHPIAELGEPHGFVFLHGD